MNCTNLALQSATSWLVMMWQLAEVASYELAVVEGVNADVSQAEVAATSVALAEVSLAEAAVAEVALDEEAKGGALEDGPFWLLLSQAGYTSW